MSIRSPASRAGRVASTAPPPRPRTSGRRPDRPPREHLSAVDRGMMQPEARDLSWVNDPGPKKGAPREGGPSLGRKTPEEARAAQRHRHRPAQDQTRSAAAWFPGGNCYQGPLRRASFCRDRRGGAKRARMGRHPPGAACYSLTRCALVRIVPRTSHARPSRFRAATEGSEHHAGDRHAGFSQGPPRPAAIGRFRTGVHRRPTQPRTWNPALADAAPGGMRARPDHRRRRHRPRASSG